MLQCPDVIIRGWIPCDIKQFLILNAEFHVFSTRKETCLRPQPTELDSKRSGRKDVMMTDRERVIERAFEIFNGIDGERDELSMSTMMKCLISFDENEKAMELYHQTNGGRVHNDIAHLLFLKACIKSNDFERGRKMMDCIASKTEKNTKRRNKKVTVTTIEFYGHFGDADNAQKVFDDIDDGERNNVTISVMM